MNVPKTLDKALVTYHNMVNAIDAFYSVDDCKDIVDQTVGFTAYYKQAKNVEMERKFVAVRLRAWRRMAEIIGNVIKGLKPEEYQLHHKSVTGVTPSRMIKKVRETFGEKTIKDLSDSRILELVKLSKISKKDFEETLQTPMLTGSLYDFFHHTPEHIARAEEAYAKHVALVNSPEYAASEAARRNVEADRIRARRAEEEFSADLRDAAEEALDEVGVTLERRDRKKMMQTLFLHNEAVHQLMRLIAFQQECTMHEVIRRGLQMYAEKLGHKWPVTKNTEKGEDNATQLSQV